MDNNKQNIIIYKTADGKASVALYAKDGNIWMNQNQLAELFATSVPNISMHISNILNDGELEHNSIIKDYLTTATDGKEYKVTFYSLDMILAIGFRVRSKRGTQFRIWANKNLKEYMVKGFVKNTSTNEIIEISHKEKAWIENNAERKLIDYNYSFELIETPDAHHPFTRRHIWHFFKVLQRMQLPRIPQ